MELIAISENSDDTRTNQVYNGNGNGDGNSNGNILQAHTLSTVIMYIQHNTTQNNTYVNVARCAYPFIIFLFLQTSLMYWTGLD